MTGHGIAGVVVVMATLHVAVLSYVFGSRHLGYILAACVCAVTVWGVVFLVNEAKRRRAMIVGVALGLIAQQAVYQFWKADIPGFWWPLAQFAALQMLIALGLNRVAP